MTDERISEKRYSEEEKKDAWGWLYDEFGEVPVPDKEQWRIAAYALALRASHETVRGLVDHRDREIAELRKLVPHWQEDAAGSTHWDTCYQEHRQCALRKIEELRASHAELVKALEIGRENANWKRTHTQTQEGRIAAAKDIKSIDAVLEAAKKVGA